MIVSIQGPSLQVIVSGIISYSTAIPNNVYVEKTAGSVIGIHKVVKVGDDGKVYYVSCDVLSDAYKVVGLSLNSANVGENVRILLFGKLQDNSFNFDTAKPIFLGLNGQIVQELPGEAQFIQVLGKVLNSNEILFDLDEPIIL